MNNAFTSTLKWHFFAMILSLALFYSCQKNEGSKEKDPVTLDENLLKSPTLFERALKNRNAGNASVFSIETVTRDADVLQVRIKGGSIADDFQVIWNGVLMESYPMQTQLIITYEGTAADFDPEKEILIGVNLKKMLGNDYKPADFHFHVLNGSVPKQTSLYPDGTTTSN